MTTIVIVTMIIIIILFGELPSPHNSNGDCNKTLLYSFYSSLNTTHVKAITLPKNLHNKVPTGEDFFFRPTSIQKKSSACVTSHSQLHSNIYDTVVSAKSTNKIILFSAILIIIYW